MTSLRLYFNLLDFALAAGITGPVAARLLAGCVRKDLRPYEEIG